MSSRGLTTVATVTVLSADTAGADRFLDTCAELGLKPTPEGYVLVGGLGEDGEPLTIVIDAALSALGTAVARGARSTVESWLSTVSTLAGPEAHHLTPVVADLDGWPAIATGG